MGVILDRPTFDRLLVDHLAAAMRFAIRLTNDPNSAEDIVQDAILRATKNWQSFAGQSRFGTWFTSIVINVFRDRVRAREVDEAISEDLDDPSIATPLRNVESEEFARLVAGLVSKLPARQREVMVLLTYEQVSITEAAGVLETTEQNVRTNMHLARERMRKLLSRYVPEIIHERRTTTT